MSVPSSSQSRRMSASSALQRELRKLRHQNRALQRRTRMLSARGAALQESISRYRGLWTSAFEGIVIHDGGVVLEANPAYARLFGYRLGEMIGRTVYEHLDPREHEELRRRMRSGARYRAQMVGVKKDGTRLTIEYHARSMKLNGRTVRVVAVRDISHLVRNQAELASSEERFRNLVEGSIQGILVHRGGKPLFANQALAEMVGSPGPEAITGLRSFGALVKPAHWKRMRQHDTRRLRGEPVPARYEFEGRRKDGRPLWMETSARAVLWDGQPAVQCTWIDITERKQREEQLREHERLLQTVVDTIPHTVFVKDAKARYRLVNRAMSNLWHRPPEYFLGHTSSQTDVFSATLARNIRRWDRQVLKTGEPMDQSDVPIPVGNETRLYHMMRYPVRDERGAVTGLVSVSENVTERRRAEQQLLDSEQRFRTLVESSIEGIAVFRGHRAMFANLAFARIAGYTSPEEVLALGSFARMTHPDDLVTLERYLTGVIKGEQREPSIEFRGIRKDGRAIWVNAAVTAVVWRGLPCILVAMLDVTERKQAAERLRQSEERFRNLIEGSIQGIVIHRNYRPLFVNQAVANIFGYASPEEMMALPDLQVINAPELREDARRTHANRLKGLSAPVRYEFEGLRKDGTRVWVECLARVVTWEGQTAVQYTMFDATERKHSEEAVRTSQRLLQIMLDAIPLCIFTKDREGRIVFVNRAQSEFDGAPAERLMGLTTEQYPNRTPEQVQQNLDWDRRVIQFGERVDVPAYLRQDGQGRGRWLRGLRLPLRDEQGRVVGQLGVNEDISERREAELALLASQRLLQTVFDTIPLRLMLKDLAGRYILVNRAMGDHYAVTPAEFLGKTPAELDFLSEEEQQGFVREDRQVISTQAPLVIPELRIAMKSGQEEVRRLIKMPIFDGQGRVDAVLGVVEDITERKSAERQREQLLDSLRQANDELAASQRLLRTIFDTIPHRLVVNDAAGRYLMVNLAMASRYGQPEAVFVGRAPDEIPFFTPEEQERFAHSNREVLATGQPFEVPEARCTLPDGREEIFRLLNVPVRDAVGRTVAAVGVAEDITERRRAEAMREDLLEDLRRANDDLRDFAYIVSHDLKAPVRGINSLAEWLAEDYADRLEDEGRENLRLLRVRTRRMATLLEGILTYSRIGRLPAALVPLDCGSVVKEVVDTLAPPPHIRVDIDGPLPTVTYDQAQLTQVFQNLIGNAIQHLGKPSGTVKISCERENGFWRFNVTDDGVGIDSRHFDRIFKIFQRLNVDQEGGGTGLGLSVVKKIVENNGGTVRVESVPGMGSVFSFTIPDGLG